MQDSTNKSDIDYNYLWNHINNLPLVTLVVAASRPGSDFLHSLFDSHPEILTFDGPLPFDTFYDKAFTIWGTKINMKIKQRLNTISPSDFFYEFAWTHVHKFYSNYDNYEKKDKLGEKGDLFNKMDINSFVNHAIKLLRSNELNRRNALLAIYGAFALARGEDVGLKKVLLHNVHHIKRIDYLIQDFKEIKIICAVRDPRSYFSNIQSLWDYTPSIMSPAVNYDLLKRVLDECTPVTEKKNCDIRVILYERLQKEPKKVMRNVCKWLSILEDSSLYESTWGGLRWRGDDMSSSISSVFNPNIYEISKERWNKIINFIDGIIIETLMYNKIKQYGYFQSYSIVHYIFVPFLIILPNINELKILLYSFRKNRYKDIIIWPYFVIKRYILMYKKLIICVFRKDTVISVL